MNFKHTLRGALLICVLGITVCGLHSAVSDGLPGVSTHFPRKKLIAVGWDSPDPRHLLDNLELMEQLPFDGVRVMIEVTGDQGEKVETARIFNGQRWQKAWFSEAIDTLKQVDSEVLTDNFLAVGPGSTVDWFDDVAWKEVVDHFRIAAWIAKKGGLKGLLFNPEQGTRLPAFSYNRQLQKDQYSYDKYAAKVRQRGREVMEAIASEYPDMVFFSMFLAGGQGYNRFVRNRGYGWTARNYYWDGEKMAAAGPVTPGEVLRQNAPSDMIEGGSYNLLPAFLNGLLDVIPEEMTLVDGLEQTYTATHEEGFIIWAHRVRTLVQSLIVPENLSKYRSQVQVGFGIYLDPYVNPEGKRYYIGPDDRYTGERSGEAYVRARMQRLEGSVQHALNNTDEYVWVWGEKHRWWPTDMKRVSPQSWEEVSPGVIDALQMAKNPEIHFAQQWSAVFQRMQDGRKGPNLIKALGSPDTDKWYIEQPEPSNGIIEFDDQVGVSNPGSFCFKGVREGCVVLDLPVQQTGYHGIRVKVKQVGKGDASLRVRWKNLDGDYTMFQTDNIRLKPLSNQGEEWQIIEGVILPWRAEGMMFSIQLAVEGQETDQDIVWFDEIELFKVN